MKKTRFLLLLLALALLLSFAACGRDKDDTPSAPVEGNGAETGKLPGTAPGAEGTPFTGVGTQEEADAHLLEKGYPLGFTLRFTGGNKGLDTAAQECFDGSTSISRDFTPRLASIYNYMLEHDIIAMTQDLTYKALKGTDPIGENTLYTLTYTNNGTSYTFRIDSAAIQAYSTIDVRQNPTAAKIQNMDSIVTHFLFIIQTELSA